ncbi:MAG: hypothetical protein ACOH18_01410 [Candidatus Saccharimonadaceae bacterium]
MSTKFFKSIAWLTSVLVVTVSLVALHAPTTGAQASTSRNITMSPASALISVKPGETAHDKFELLNSGDDAYTVFTSVSPYRVVGLDYTPDFTQLPGSTDTASWVQIANQEVTVASKTAATVQYTVSVPSGTAPGGYYAVIFAETRPPADAQQSSGVVPHNRVGNILYITVQGPVQTSGDFEAQPVSGVRIQTDLPVGFKISNTGGIHFQSTVNVSIKGITGKELYKANIERYVLPQTERQINIDWVPSSPFGIYTVSRSANVASAEKKISDEIVIFIQPWVLVAFLVLVVMIGIYFNAQAKQRRNQLAEQKPKQEAKPKK